MYMETTINHDSSDITTPPVSGSIPKLRTKAKLLRSKPVRKVKPPKALRRSSGPSAPTISAATTTALSLASGEGWIRMTSKFRRVGDSYVLTIPMVIRETLGWMEGTPMTMEINVKAVAKGDKRLTAYPESTNPDNKEKD